MSRKYALQRGYKNDMVLRRWCHQVVFLDVVERGQPLWISLTHSACQWQKSKRYSKLDPRRHSSATSRSLTLIITHEETHSRGLTNEDSRTNERTKTHSRRRLTNERRLTHNNSRTKPHEDSRTKTHSLLVPQDSRRLYSPTKAPSQRLTRENSPLTKHSTQS